MAQRQPMRPLLRNAGKRPGFSPAGLDLKAAGGSALPLGSCHQRRGGVAGRRQGESRAGPGVQDSPYPATSQPQDFLVTIWLNALGVGISASCKQDSEGAAEARAKSPGRRGALCPVPGGLGPAGSCAADAGPPLRAAAGRLPPSPTTTVRWA